MRRGQDGGGGRCEDREGEERKGVEWVANEERLNKRANDGRLAVGKKGRGGGRK